ncbi:hypothetical protein D6817_05785 [Candidatus Pacearchaeota archaeon]|nr:MAG: hypothetical protein D6817_05785 [Candidatus Pacearchaeota archaeon]
MDFEKISIFLGFLFGLLFGWFAGANSALSTAALIFVAFTVTLCLLEYLVQRRNKKEENK